MTHPARLPIDDLLTSCTISTGRRGGPGGQHRNKVETAVIIEHLPSGIKAEANERRRQADNRRQAIVRLRLRLAIELRDDPPSARSELWSSRTRGGKLSVSVDHDDFAALLSELVDCLHSVDYVPTDAAQQLNVSASQLVKLLRSYPPALTYVNAQRQSLGIHSLR